MAYARYQNTAVDDAGNVIPNATVEVREDRAGRPVVPLFSDRAGTVPMGNPIQTDAQGRFAFHVRGGAYWLRIFTGPSQEPTLQYIDRYVAIGTAAERDVEDLASALSAGIATFGTLDQLEQIIDLSTYDPETDSGVGALVWSDPDVTKNGYYLPELVSSGPDVYAWVRQRGLPDTLARMVVTGGTADAIEAELVQGIDPATVAMLWIEAPGTNTGPVSINGKEVLTVGGESLLGGQWLEGRTYWFTDEGANFKLRTESDISGLVAQAEAAATAALDAKGDADSARDAAEGFRNEAAGYAAGLNLPSIGSGDAGKGIRVNPEGTGYEFALALPDIEAGDARKTLRVSDDESGVEWATAPRGSGELFKAVADLLADDNEVIGYEGSGASVTVETGDIVVAQGLRYEVAASDATDAHVVTAGGVKLYAIAIDGYLSIEQFNAALDGTTDDGVLVQNVADICLSLGHGLAAPVGKVCRIETPVDLRGLKQINFQSDISTPASSELAEIPVVIGGWSGSIGGNVYFSNVYEDGIGAVSGDVPTRPTIRLFGSKTAIFRLGYVSYFQMWADSATVQGTSNAYNNIEFTGVVRVYEITDSGEDVSWNNENYHRGRFQVIRIKGVGYSHNHNKFDDPSLEASFVEIRLENCSTTRIYGARLESVSGSAGIYFDANTYANTIISTYSGTGSPNAQFRVPSMPITDLGKGNVVITEASHVFDKVEAFAVGHETIAVGNVSTGTMMKDNAAQVIFDNLTTAAFVVPGLYGHSVNASRWIALSNYIPVQYGDVGYWECDWPGSTVREVIYVFDENMRPLTTEGSGGAYIVQGGLNFSTSNGLGKYTGGANRAAATMNNLAFGVNRPEVRFIRVGLYASTGTLVRRAACQMFLQPIGRGGRYITPPMDQPKMIAGAPSRGLVPLNYAVTNSATGDVYRASYVHQTVLASGASGGATSVTVSQAASIANADIVGILLDDGTTHWTAVSSLSGATFDVAALPSAAGAGNRVAFVRWVIV